jgi:hypothetical protein
MTNNHPRNSTPVWRCIEAATCGAQWAAWERDLEGPFCHCSKGEPAGFTYGEVLEAAERLGFVEDVPVHLAEPVPELVQLVTLPRDVWIGLPVFHPSSQTNVEATWLVYDTGIIVSVEEDRDFEGEFRCSFITSVGPHNTALRYGPNNLWVPKVLADRLVES